MCEWIIDCEFSRHPSFPACCLIATRPVRTLLGGVSDAWLTFNKRLTETHTPTQRPLSFFFNIQHSVTFWPSGILMRKAHQRLVMV